MHCNIGAIIIPRMIETSLFESVSSRGEVATRFVFHSSCDLEPSRLVGGYSARLSCACIFYWSTNRVYSTFSSTYFYLGSAPTFNMVSFKQIELLIQKNQLHLLLWSTVATTLIKIRQSFQRWHCSICSLSS